MPLLAVNHHYFREHAPGRGIYPTSSEQMKANIASIRARGWTLGTQKDIADYCNGNLDKKICVITFDDGLKEQMQCLTLLESLGASAMFFVSTAPHIFGRVLDVHKMHMIRTVLSDEEVAIHLDRHFAFDRHVFDPTVLALQYRYDTEISQKIKYFLNFVLDAEQKDAWVGATFRELFSDEARIASELYMDASDWEILAKRSCLGTHGHAHLPLATLSTEKMRQDIEMSLQTIKKATGTDIHGIAYPFGGKTAVSSNVFDISKACGLRYGFTMQRALNTDTPERSSAMSLNRIDVNDLAGYLA
jgi:peptidoglycan/xylan/chitin deacetylase (PgdA/CDA1 family)